MPALPFAIDALHDAFCRYPLAANTGPCTHCYTDDDEREVHAAPLRQLSPEQLGNYAASALNTWGGVAELKHFLPRIFELAAADGFSWPTVEVVFGKLRQAGWRAWPLNELRAVEDYLDAWWAERITSPFEPYRDDVDDALCALAQAHDDIMPFARQLLVTPGEWPLRRVAAAIWYRDQYRNAFWGGSRPRGLRELFASQPVVQRLEDGFFTASSPQVEVELSRALDVLRA